MKFTNTVISICLAFVFVLNQHLAIGQEENPAKVTKASEKQSEKHADISKSGKKEPNTKEGKPKGKVNAFPVKKEVDPAKTKDFAALSSEADKFFIHEHYKFALPLYLKLLAIKPEDMLYNYRTGISYLHSTNKSLAVGYLEKAQKLDLKKHHLDIEYFLAKAYHHKLEFDNAIAHYNLYKKTLNTKHEHERSLSAEIDRLIYECNTGKILVASPTNVKVEHICAKINSPYSEKFPLITSDGNVLYFSSGRPLTKGGLLDPANKQYYDDIYFSTKINEEWTPAKQLDTVVNTKGHDEPLAISFDGQKMFIQNSENDGDILWTEKKNNTWSTPVEMSSRINSPDFEEGACLSPDGKTFYFSSDREGGLGGLDLYYCKLQPDGSWSTPISMGPQINTRYDEEDPFILGDGKTFYFSSNGHNTMGGYDIFVSQFDQSKGRWTKPLNLGYPVNSADDEVHISWTADGLTGYYSEDNEQGFGDEDIYVVTLGVAPKVSEVVAAAEPNIEVQNVENLLEDKSRQVNASVGSAHDNMHVAKSVNPNCPKAGDVLKDKVHFSLNENYSLTEYSKTKILNVVKLMESCPKTKIEIEGFSDNFGDHAKNYLLISKKRAEAVYNFMLQKGVDKQRLQIKAYEEKALDGMTNSEGNSKNRRVEFKVLDN